MAGSIEIRGAREHNLKDISLSIPKNKIVVFTGVSGSGKSSLVFDTIYAEAQRQLIETFSAYARARLPKPPRPDIDEITNISTPIVIDQKRIGSNRRSTVGTFTEIYNYLRLLYARTGKPYVGNSDVFSFNNPSGMCLRCRGVGSEVDVDEKMLLDENKSVREGAVLHPSYEPGKWYYKELLACGLFNTDIPVKEMKAEEREILLNADSVFYRRDRGVDTKEAVFEGVITKFKRLFLNKEHTRDIPEKYLKFFTLKPCRSCKGARLNSLSLSSLVGGKNIAELSGMEMTELIPFLEKIKGPLAEPIIKNILKRVQNLVDIGVGYLTLDRPTPTLSGGESQRVKTARQLNCDLVDMMYIMDEPSIGLHPHDITMLRKMLIKLRDKGNSVLVVEHDSEIICGADYVVDLGPGAGVNGGELSYAGNVDGLKKSGTVTGSYLGKGISVPPERRKSNESLVIANANLHNLKNITVEIPLGIFVCITGVAGSGKSTLINDIFAKIYPEAVVIDQSPAGRSSRSNPLTYTGAFDQVRKEFSSATGLPASMFSFNSEGACPKCNGTGSLEIEMHFMDPVRTVCPLCGGKRYTEEVLSLSYKENNIYEVLSMTVNEGLNFFENRKITEKLKLLARVGLGYLTLGQPLSTLSGGEAQRIKIASELGKSGNIYVLDEPTTGLHAADAQLLLNIINDLVNRGNSLVVIEHNPDIIKSADRIIDMGPGGGSAGGQIIAVGTPEEIAEVKDSFTGKFLKKYLER